MEFKTTLKSTLKSVQNKSFEYEETIRQQKYAVFLNEIAEKTKAEFIDGKVVVHSPASLIHIDANTSLTTMLKLHVDKYKLGWLASEKALVKMKNSDNDFEPDICFFSKQKSNTFNSKTCQFPPPDLAIEIVSKSSQKRDREIKFRDYAKHNVAEYWIIEPDKREIEQYYLEKKGVYLLAKKWTETEIITSVEITKLKIPVAAIFFYEALDEYLFGEYRKDIENYKDKIKVIGTLHEKQLAEQKKQTIKERRQKEDAIDVIAEEQKKLKEKDIKLKEKDIKLKEKDIKLKEKDIKLKEKDIKLKETDKKLKEKDIIIEQLLKQLDL